MKTKGSILALLTICFVSLFVDVTGGHAATIYVANYGDGTCSLTNAQSAYTDASAGDTVSFPSGTCTWSSALTIGKPLTVTGNSTNLVASGSMSNGFFYLSGMTTASLVRITGFTFQMTNHNTTHAVGFNNLSLTRLRIDHNIFYFGSNPMEVAGCKGVIDHNYFYNAIVGIYFTAGSRTQADDSWASMAAGTGDALFIEDNHFIDNNSWPSGTTYSQEKIGSFNGGKIVIRHNEIDSDAWPFGTSFSAGWIEMHGSAAGGCANGYWEQNNTCRRAQSVVEIYNNYIHGQRIDKLATLRGAANIVHDNVATSTAFAPIVLLMEEEYSDSQWSPLRTAWPAEDQVHNSFFWNNTSNGTQMNTSFATYFTVAPSCSAYPASCTAGLQKDRDFFLHAPCASTDTTDGYGSICTHGKETFTGANGASGSYPTNNTVYTSSGTMVFTASGDNAYYGYTPNTYPHPLVSGTTPSTHAVTPSAGPNGSISPNTAQTVNDSSTILFTVTPNPNYSASVAGTCGGTLAGATYTTSPITADCTATATFTLNPVIVKPSIPTGLTVK